MMPAEQYQALSNVDSELVLCGSLMLHNSRIDAVADMLAPEDFSDPLLADIYSVIVREAALGRPANPITLKPYLADHPSINEVGGLTFLNKLAASNDAAWASSLDMANQIKALSARRSLVAGLNAASALAADPAQTNEAVISAADDALTSVTAVREQISQPTAAQALDRLMEAFDEPLTGVTCGTIASLDKLLGPIRPKQMVVAAGRPGMGKTAVALSYAIGASLEGHGVLFISLEMGAEELADRMASDLCFDGRRGVPFSAIRDKNLNKDQRLEIARARERMATAPFRIVDAGSMSVGRLRMIVRRYKRRFAAEGFNLDLVVVDYLQLMSSDHQGAGRYETITEVSIGLKSIAKEQEVGILALAQLSREVEKRPDKRPQLSDLRESGQIEQDADGVLFLYRHEYYLRQAEPDEGDPARIEWEHAVRECEGSLELILAKRRSGRIGTAKAVFHAANQAVRG